jgi:hypothetical protein
MKIPELGLDIFRRLRRCERECLKLTGKRYPENPAFVFCEKHRVWRLCL